MVKEALEWDSKKYFSVVFPSIKNKSGTLPELGKGKWKYNSFSLHGPGESIFSDSQSRETFNKQKIETFDPSTLLGQLSIHPNLLGQKGKVLQRREIPPLNEWKLMSPRDWFNVIESTFLLRSNKIFCNKFGAEITDLKFICANVAPISRWNDGSVEANIYIAYQEKYLKNRTLNNDDEKREGFKEFNTIEQQYHNLVRIKMVGSLEDANHWSHLEWMFCNYVEDRKWNLYKLCSK